MKRAHLGCVVTIPLSGAPCPDERNLSLGLQPGPVSRAMIAKADVAPSRSRFTSRVECAASASVMLLPLPRAYEWRLLEGRL